MANHARTPALREACTPGRFGAATPSAGVTMTALTGLTLIDLRGNPQHGRFLASAQAALGCTLPLQPNTAVCASNCTVLWLGPDEWLLSSKHADNINEQLAIAGGFLTDVSHGRAALRIGGPHVRELLAKDCSLDLHPRSFQAGHCAQTALAHIGVLLYLPPTGDAFELYCARSYAQHLWHWLTEAAAEYGYEVTAPIDYY